RICSLMIELAPRDSGPLARIGGQPIAVAAVALSLVLIGIGSIALWRSYTGSAPETDRVVATRQLQARTAQASEQLVEKTKGAESPRRHERQPQARQVAGLTAACRFSPSNVNWLTYGRTNPSHGAVHRMA